MAEAAPTEPLKSQDAIKTYRYLAEDRNQGVARSLRRNLVLVNMPASAKYEQDRGRKSCNERDVIHLVYI